MADEIFFVGAEPLQTWATNPAIRRKVLEKLKEVQKELERTGGAVNSMQHFLLVDMKDDGKGLSLSAEALEGWVQSLMESMTYIAKMLRGVYGAGHFRGFGLAAMEKGDRRATADGRAAGVKIPDTASDVYDPVTLRSEVRHPAG
jgi:hypothetical protein